MSSDSLPTSHAWNKGNASSAQEKLEMIKRKHRQQQKLEEFQQKKKQDPDANYLHNPSMVPSSNHSVYSKLTVRKHDDPDDSHMEEDSLRYSSQSSSSAAARVRSTDTDDLEAQRGGGILSKSSVDATRSYKRVQAPFSDDDATDIATCNTSEVIDDDLAAVSSIKTFKKISPAWIFGGGGNKEKAKPKTKKESRSTREAADPRSRPNPNSDNNSLLGTLRKQVSQDRTGTRRVVARDPPSHNKYSTISGGGGDVEINTTHNANDRNPRPHGKFMQYMEQKVADLNLADDLEPARKKKSSTPPPSEYPPSSYLSPTDTFDSYPTMFDQTPYRDNRNHNSNKYSDDADMEWTKRETSLSFVSNLKDDQSYSDVSSWISMDRVMKSTPSFPPASSSPKRTISAATTEKRRGYGGHLKNTIPLAVHQSPEHMPMENHNKWKEIKQSVSGKLNRSNGRARGPASGSRTHQHLPRPPPPPDHSHSSSGHDSFVDESSEPTASTRYSLQKPVDRSGKWDKFFLAAFLLASVVVAIVVGFMVLGGGSKKVDDSDWVRITDPPTSNPFGVSPEYEDPYETVVPMTTVVADNGAEETDQVHLEWETNVTKKQKEEHTVYEPGSGNQETDTSNQDPLTNYVLPLPDYTRQAIENDANSPQAKAYRWFLNDPNWTSYPVWRQFQRYAMVTLFYATNGHAWTLSNSWLLYTISECQWYSNSGWDGSTGVCDEEEERLQSLMLGSNDLFGTLPLEIGFLGETLQQMDVRSNRIQGSIPPTISLLTNLMRFDIETNSFTGSIPSEMGLLTSLIIADMSGNNLTQALPTEFGVLANLRELSVASNLLTGAIPTEFGSMTAMEKLSVENNALNSTIPAHLSRLTELNVLRIGTNQVRAKWR